MSQGTIGLELAEQFDWRPPEVILYPAGGGVPIYPEMAYSFPRLYLASGVTTARTAGSMEPYTDLNVKRLIDTGQMPADP